MKSWHKTSWTFALCALGVAFGSVAHAQDEQATRMRTALAAPDRSQENKDRDAVRKPIETIQFLGIKTGQTVMDVFAFGGWFTEVLSAAVGPTGKVYTQNPAFAIGQAGFADREAALIKRLTNVTPVHGDIAAANLNGKLDAAITALNLHDLYNGKDGEATAQAFVKSVYDALKPGGVFGVIDHVGIAGQNNQQFHRIQLQQAKDVLTKAGFKIEAESDILKNPADDHTKGVRDPSVSRHTDQFLIRARKPS